MTQSSNRLYTEDALQTEQEGRAEFANLPGWATWSAAEAEDWIETNVTNLATAKAALKAMAKAIVFLRKAATKQ